MNFAASSFPCFLGSWGALCCTQSERGLWLSGALPTKHDLVWPPLDDSPAPHHIPSSWTGFCYKATFLPVSFLLRGAHRISPLLGWGLSSSPDELAFSSSAGPFQGSLHPPPCPRPDAMEHTRHPRHAETFSSVWTTQNSKANRKLASRETNRC